MYIQAKFITRPLSTYGGVSPSAAGQGQALSPGHSPGGSSLPSFLDTYTPSVMVTGLDSRHFSQDQDFRLVAKLSSGQKQDLKESGRQGRVSSQHDQDVREV